MSSDSVDWTWSIFSTKDSTENAFNGNRFTTDISSTGRVKSQ